MKRAVLTSVVTVAMVFASGAHAQSVSLDQQKGLRGRLLVAPELLKKNRALEPERADLLRGSANVRRWMGRGQTDLSEPAPALLVVLEGKEVKLEDIETPRLVVQGMRITPGSLVVPRPTVIKVENRQQSAITLVGRRGEPIVTVAPGAVGDATLLPGEHLLAIREMPFATSLVRILERGRVLPVTKEGDIPLQVVPGGDYVVSVYFGSTLLKKAPLVVPEQGLVFVDASVSAQEVADVVIKDSSVRVAVPPSPGGGTDGP